MLDTGGQAKSSVDRLEEIEKIHRGDCARGEGAYGKSLQAILFRCEY